MPERKPSVASKAGNNGNGNTEQDAVSLDAITIDPADIGAFAGNDDNGEGNGDIGADGRRTRKRRSDAGRTRSSKKKADRDSIDSVKRLLHSLHMMGSIMLAMPELILDEKEADELSKAIAQVTRHYNFETTEKAVDWSSLMMSLAMIYGPRFVAIRNNRRAKNVQQPVPDFNPADAGFAQTYGVDPRNSKH